MPTVIFGSKNKEDRRYMKDSLKSHELSFVYVLDTDLYIQSYCEKRNIEFETFKESKYKKIIKKSDDVILFDLDGSELIEKAKDFAIEEEILIDIYSHEEDELYETILKSQEVYVNDEDEDAIELEDEEFDCIVDYVSSKKKINPLIGAKPKKDDIQLPYPMASLNKISHGKDSLKKLTKFMNENPGPYSCSSKVDGTSLEVIYTYDDEKDKTTITVATGGDGVIGKDVTFISEYVEFQDLKMNCVIRGELTIKDNDFEEIAPLLREKGRKGTNSRNAVNGMVNRKDANPEILSKCFFNAFGIMSSDEPMSKQFKKLKKWGFKTPKPILYDYDDSEEFLTIIKEELETRNENKKYRTDGLVITSESNFYKNIENSNPTCSFAFKINTYAVSKVRKIKWKVTRYGYLTPIAIIDPVDILGTTMSKASAVHARELINKGIGPGSIVIVTFRGDIIPKIEKCVKKSKPTWPKNDWHWHENRIEIMVDNPELYPEITILQMHYFLQTLGVKDCGKKRLTKLYENGMHKLDDLVRLREEDMEDIEGFGETLSTKIVKQIKEALAKITWPKLMSGSGIFGEGLGEERFQMVISHYPDWRMEDLTAEDLIKINGIGPVYSEQISEQLPEFKKWIKKNKMCIPRSIFQEKRTQDLRGQVICFTGIGCTDSLQQELVSRGAIVKMKSWVNSATILVVKDASFTSRKTEKAEEHGTKVISIQKFMKKYKYKG